MKIQTPDLELPHVTMTLPDGRRILVNDQGTIEVHDPNFVSYYRIDLPAVATAARHCSERDADTSRLDYPYSGTFTITAEHVH